MGYDMRTIERPAVDETKAAELKAEADRLWEEVKVFGPRSPESKAAFEAWDKANDAYEAVAHPGYFRLNNRGMYVYTDVMVEVGMAHQTTSAIAHDEWPKYPDEEGEQEMAAYEAILTPLLSRHGDDPTPTIPTHKFGSNDGWIVTPEEIRAALDAYEKFQNDPGRDLSALSEQTVQIIATGYWGQWIAYLQRAAEHGGFAVN